MQDLTDLLLKNRNIKTAEAKDIFLNPSYEKHLHDPFLMKDMEKACARIFSAIEKNEKITVYSDYDCDGIPGAVILHDFFKKIGYNNIAFYIPHRHDEGYGLHMDAILGFITDGTKLLITIDLGITAIEEVKIAQKAGIDVIITDHHLPQDPPAGGIPKAFAILNPKQKGDKYPFDMLCGAGVVFKFVQGMIKYVNREASDFSSTPARLNDVSRSGGEFGPLGQSSPSKSLASRFTPGWEKWLLDMAGLATLSDMVPLVDENRILAYYGLMVLRKSPRPGLQALFHAMKMDQRYITEDDITFMLTPRLNAASRMDDPYRAFELLKTTDPIEAGTLATHLTSINDNRKSMVAQIMKEVKHTLSTREESSVIVLGNPKWAPGVLGLIAGKILDTYERPVFVWGQGGDGTELKGSCRSDGSVSVVELMTSISESFITFGGHELAGGFSVSHEQVHFLSEKLSYSYESIKRDKNIEVKLVDADLSLDDVTRANYDAIAKLAPFGLANSKPVFRFQNVEIADNKLFGKEKNHLELLLKSPTGKLIKAISFFYTDAKTARQFEKGSTINLLASFELSHFAGRTELRLRIVDIL